MASLEGGVGALATASGLAAQTVAITTLLERRRPHRRVARTSTAAATTSSRSRWRASASRRRSWTRATWPPGAAAIRPRTRLLYGETIGNPRLDVLDIAPIADVADAAGVPAADRQHLRHALPLPADRARRPPGLALGDQVDLRPRHHDRRGAHRRRHLPLGRRPLPGPDRAEPRLPGAALRRDVRELRVRHEGARRDDARPGPGALPVQRLPAAPGPRDPVAADGPPRVEHASPSRSSCGTTRAWSG